MVFRTSGHAGVDTKAMLRMVQAKGAGYAMSKQQELETMQHVAHSTGTSHSVHHNPCCCGLPGH